MTNKQTTPDTLSELRATDPEFDRWMGSPEGQAVLASSREYASRRKAEIDATIAAGRDPNDFGRNERGEILCCVIVDAVLLEEIVGPLAERHRCEDHGWHIETDLTYFDVPEPEVEPLLTAIRKLGYEVENYGRINPSGIPEDLD